MPTYAHFGGWVISTIAGWFVVTADILETPPLWRNPMTTRSTALCSSERIFVPFKGSRLTPERSATSSDLGSRIHSVPRSSGRHGAQTESSSSSASSASAAVTLAREAQTPRFLNRSTNSKTVQRRDSPPTEASHDGLPQSPNGFEANRRYRYEALGRFSAHRLSIPSEATGFNCSAISMRSGSVYSFRSSTSSLPFSNASAEPFCRVS
jgi:hypothetical protein